MTDNKKVSLMAERGGDSRMWTAEQMLVELLDGVRSGEIKPEKMLVMFWEPRGDQKLTFGYRAVNFASRMEYIGFLASTLQLEIQRFASE